MDECICEKYAEQRRSSPSCMAFWCPVHDDIDGMFARLERATTEERAKEEIITRLSKHMKRLI